MARNRHQVARTTRRVFGRNNYNRTLEAAVDPERQLEISRERRANLVPAEVLYSNNRSTARHRVYEHYSEQRILCIGENQINLRLCNEESYESLRNSGLQHIHLGIFMIRLHALHRRSAGTNALVVLRDTRWEDSRQIIATMESSWAVPAPVDKGGYMRSDKGQWQDQEIMKLVLCTGPRDENVLAEYREPDTDLEGYELKFSDQDDRQVVKSERLSKEANTSALKRFDSKEARRFTRAIKSVERRPRSDQESSLYTYMMMLKVLLNM
ncbi:hypothetical protein Tco_0481817 [Tanacetum coccineum]